MVKHRKYSNMPLAAKGGGVGWGNLFTHEAFRSS